MANNVQELISSLPDDKIGEKNQKMENVVHL